MTDVLEQLKGLLVIDKHTLDDEIVKQPNLFFQVAEACADAVAERDACKEELETIDAELDGVVRRQFEKQQPPTTKSRGTWPTEAMVKHAIQSHKRHGSAFDTYILAKTRADKLLALKDAFNQRNYMLRELAGLFAASYWENTAVKGDARTDKVVYERNRQRLAEARAQRIK